MTKDKSLINTHWRGKVKDLWTLSDKSFVIEYAIIGLTDDQEDEYQYNIITNKLWATSNINYHINPGSTEFMQGHDYMLANCVQLPLSVGSRWQPNASVPDADKKIFEILCHDGAKIVLLDYANNQALTTTPHFLRSYIAIDQ